MWRQCPIQFRKTFYLREDWECNGSTSCFLSTGRIGSSIRCSSSPKNIESNFAFIKFDPSHALPCLVVVHQEVYPCLQSRRMLKQTSKRSSKSPGQSQTRWFKCLQWSLYFLLSRRTIQDGPSHLNLPPRKTRRQFSRSDETKAQRWPCKWPHQDFRETRWLNWMICTLPRKYHAIDLFLIFSVKPLISENICRMSSL